MFTTYTHFLPKGDARMVWSAMGTAERRLTRREEKAWVRERLHLIKETSRRFGVARAEIRKLEDPGFDF